MSTFQKLKNIRDAARALCTHPRIPSLAKQRGIFASAALALTVAISFIPHAAQASICQGDCLNRIELAQLKSGNSTAPLVNPDYARPAAHIPAAVAVYRTPVPTPVYNPGPVGPPIPLYKYPLSPKSPPVDSRTNNTINHVEPPGPPSNPGNQISAPQTKEPIYFTTGYENPVRHKYADGTYLTNVNGTWQPASKFIVDALTKQGIGKLTPAMLAASRRIDASGKAAIVLAWGDKSTAHVEDFRASALNEFERQFGNASNGVQARQYMLLKGINPEGSEAKQFMLSLESQLAKHPEILNQMLHEVAMAASPPYYGAQKVSVAFSGISPS